MAEAARQFVHEITPIAGSAGRPNKSGRCGYCKRAGGEHSATCRKAKAGKRGRTKARAPRAEGPFAGALTRLREERARIDAAIAALERLA